MVKKFFRIIKYPVSIVVGAYTYFWFIFNPLENYYLPSFLYWIPDKIGWHALFIVLGIIAGYIAFVICAAIADEEWMKED